MRSSGGFIIITLMPCMGLGKVAAQVTRTAAYILKDAEDDLVLLSIPLLFTGDETEIEKYTKNPVIAIDGCYFKCASHICKFTRIDPAARVFVIDVTRATGEKPGRARKVLEDTGKRLAQEVANVVSDILPKVKDEHYEPQEAINIPNPEDIDYEKVDWYYLPKGAPRIEGIEEASEESSQHEVCIFPCMGINKPEAQVSQLAGYLVKEDNPLVWSELLCVPALLACVQEDIDFVVTMPTIIIDGCEKNCASKMYSYKGVAPAARVFIPDFIKETGLEPGREGDSLNKAGWALSERIAQKVGELSLRLMNRDYPLKEQEPNLYGFQHYQHIDREMGYVKKKRCWISKDMPDLSF
jgi:uncharacterized metal-binding protein